MTLVHKKNLLLPEEERGSIAEDDVINLNEISVCLDEIVAESRAIVENRLLERCLRLIGNRRTLKYISNGDILSRTVNVFHDLLIEKRMSFVMKTKLLTEMHKICGKKSAANPLVGLRPIAWKLLWKDAMDIAGRMKKDQSLASEQPIVGYMSRLVEFLHGSRGYFTMSNEEADLLVQEAMEMLKDPRHVHCVDGLLMLLNCLPTKYYNYAHWLPQWVTMWSSMNHNAQWDMCWLTLLTRARKHTDIRAFSWQALMPLLTLKSRELLSLPVARGKNFQYKEFPFVFPRYYDKLTTISTDARYIALNKIGKLLYFASMQEALLISLPNTLVSSTDGVKDGVTNTQMCNCVYVDPLSITPPSLSATEPITTTNAVSKGPFYPGYNEGAYVLSGVAEIVAFFQSLRPFYYASSSGNWSQNLAYFTTTMVGEHSRHIGRSLGHQLLGPDAYTNTAAEGVNNGSKYFAFEAPMHLPSMKYLVGMLTLLSLESLYGKNHMMSHYCSSNLKNLCAVDPALGHIILPFLLRALDPAAVNQPHQAPIAILTASVVFKPLLYPRPVILSYLPDLLKLVLPGMDPCDPTKTSVTLKLLSVILSWLPLKTNYTVNTTETASSTLATSMSVRTTSYLSSVHILPTTKYNNVTTPGQPPVPGSGVNGNGSVNSSGDAMKETETAAHLDALGAMIGDWALSLLDKVFALLEAHEAPQTGKGKRQDSVTDGALGETMGYLFQAVDPVAEPLLWRSLEDKIMGYFSKSSPVNATKVSAKIIDALINGNSACLSRVLPLLLDHDVMSLNCSQDKLAFRLRLAGGAVRSCQGASDCLDTLVLPLILQVVSNPALVGHTEKNVRKATGKLAKEALKGLTSFYPKGIRPLCVSGRGSGGEGGLLQLGTPTSLESVNSSWYVPTPHALSAGAKILQATVLQPMQALVSLLTGLSSPDNTLTVKKAEESIVQGMKMIQKGLRGAAEVLGDDYTPGACVTFPTTPSRGKLSQGVSSGVPGGLSTGSSGGGSDDVYEGNGNDSLLFHSVEDSSSSTSIHKDRRHVVATGRDQVLQALANSSLPNAQTDRDLYLSLRFVVMDFLVFLEDALTGLAAGAGASTITSGSVMTIEQSNEKTDIVPSGCVGGVYASLADSTSTRAAWSKTLKILINSRMASLKAVDSVQSWFTSTKRACRSLLVKTLLKRCRMNARASISTGTSATTTGDVSSLDYWQGHDLSTNTVANGAWLLHARRIKHFAVAVNRRNVEKPDNTQPSSSSSSSLVSLKRPLLVHLLEVIIRLCGHEYDAIRAKAIKTYTSVSSRFGHLSFDLVKPLLSRMTTVGTPFAVITGALSLLAQDRHIRTITSQWHMTDGFIRLFFACPMAVAAIVEQDKRQRLQAKLANLFVLYVDNWHHYPLTTNAAASAGRLMQGLLASVGFDGDSGKVLEGGNVPLALNPRTTATSTTTVDAIVVPMATDASATASGPGLALAQGQGLRQDTFTAFVIMHFIGHNDITTPLGALAWSLHILCTAHGQPTQNVALAAFVRIVVGMGKILTPHVLLFTPTSEHTSEQISKQAVGDERVDGCIVYLQQALHNSTNNTVPGAGTSVASAVNTTPSSSVSWLSLLQGLSQALPKAAEDGSSAQWSAGIDQVLRCALYMRLILPRRLTNARTDHALFSARFRPEIAGLISSLAVLLIRPSSKDKGQGQGGHGITMTPNEVIEAALSASRQLPSTSEEETRANNVTCAEVFAGLLRGLATQLHHQLTEAQTSSSSSASEAQIKATLASVEQVCVDYFIESVEKLSVDYFAHWAEAVYYVMSCGLFHSSGPLCALVMDGCKRVLAPTSSAASSSSSILSSAVGSMSVSTSGGVGVTSVESSEEEGLVRQGRSLTMVRAAIMGEIVSCSTLGLGGGLSTRDAPIGTILTQLLADPDSDVLSSFRNCRLELGKVFAVLAESYGNSKTSPDLTPVLVKLLSAAAAADLSEPPTSTTTSSSSSSTSNGQGDTLATTTVTVTSNQITPQQTAAKNAIETACAWSQFLSQMYASRTLASLPTGHATNPEGVGSLVGLVLRGTGRAENELASICAESTYFHVHSAISGGRGATLVTPSSPSSLSVDLLGITLTALVAQRSHQSFHVRQATVLAVTSFMLDNWPLLSETERKSVKETFSEALHDNKPEVQLLAVDGMVAYLAMQPLAVLNKLATAYIHNSDVMARQDAKKRKADKSSSTTTATGASAGDSATSSKPDKQHTTTVMMMACIIQALPYDLPSFLPALITSFVRHVGVASLKDTVTRTVQMFKRTHQVMRNSILT